MKSLSWGWLYDGGPTVIHINVNIARYGVLAVLGGFYGSVHGVDHP